MTDLLLVTGGTGLAGSAIALRAAADGKRVRVLVREGHDLRPLRSAGIEIAPGDITDIDSLSAAMQGVTDVINTAAALGGTSDSADQNMWAVNHRGALNVLDAARESGVRRCVHLDSNSIWDAQNTLNERSPLIPIGPFDSAYVSAKRAAYAGALHRAMRGQDIVFVTPGAIYGPGPFTERALDSTSFNSVALRALRGEIDTYVNFPFPWTFVPDLVDVTLSALAHGRAGRRYLALGRDEDVSSVANYCNAVAEIAGVSHRVRDLDPNDPDAPDIGTRRQFLDRIYGSPMVDASWTNAQLGTSPTPRPKALAVTVDWLRRQGKLTVSSSSSV